MKKIILCVLAALAVSALAFAQCTSSNLNIAGSIYNNKCYGSAGYYNEFVDKVTYYYDYEYSAFTKSPIACQNPVTNLDAGTFWGRLRSWGANGSCPALYGCPTPTLGNETIYVSYFDHNPYHFASNILLEACQADGTDWFCSGAGLPTWTAGSPPTCNLSDATFRYNAAITNVANYFVDGSNNIHVDITFEIYNPNYGTGLYSDNVPLIAGYRMFYEANPTDTPPYDGWAYNWTPTNNYILYTPGVTSANTYTYIFPAFTGSDINNLYLSYMPVFLNRAGSSIQDLFNRGLTTTPNNSVPITNGYVGCLYDPPYFCEYQPTFVTLASFTGRYEDLEHVGLAWKTASESNAAGFNLSRSLNGADWVMVNSALIPAKGQGGGGAEYTYTDNLPKQRVYQTWQYKVEEISSGGQRTSQATTTVGR